MSRRAVKKMGSKLGMNSEVSERSAALPDITP
jgi:hypothetical protein